MIRSPKRLIASGAVVVLTMVIIGGHYLFVGPEDQAQLWAKYGALVLAAYTFLAFANGWTMYVGGGSYDQYHRGWRIATVVLMSVLYLFTVSVLFGN